MKDEATHGAISIEREQLGKMLYYFAWAVEVLAVMIGLGIAIMIAYTGHREMISYRDTGLNFGDYTNVAISMLPFVMVAFVEITKIPFAGAFYKTNKLLWKTIFAVSLIFLGFITFESAMNGFERNFNSLTFSIDKYKKQVVVLDESINLLVEQRESAKQLTSEDIEENFNERREHLSSDRERNEKGIQEQKNNLRASVESEYIVNLKETRDGYKSTLEQLRRERQQEVERITRGYEASGNQAMQEIGVRRRALEQQISNASREIKNAKSEGDKKIEAASIFSRKGVKDEVQKEISEIRRNQRRLQEQLNSITFDSIKRTSSADYEKSISSITNRYGSRIREIQKMINDISFKIAKATATREKDVEQIIIQYTKEQAAVNSNYQKQQTENEAERKRLFERLELKRSEIDGIDGQLVMLRKQRVELRNKINVKVGGNQVYRMSQWWYSKESAADLERHQVMVIALIWFGSLAALVAFTGTLLALASYVVRDPYATERTDRSAVNASLQRLIRAARRYVIYRRRLQRKPVIREVPKEIIKEIAVEKVVTVEKPVQIIRKVLVHVPLYTNDKNLLNISTATNTSLDVSDASVDSLA